MDTSPTPFPFDNVSPSHEPSASRTSANPRVTAPVSPSIEDLANVRVAGLDNNSPGEPGNPEGLWAFDDSTRSGTLSGASRGFKRHTKGQRSSAGHVKTEHVDGANVGSSQKSELEREMELFEAAEREEEARLLTSLRQSQSSDCSPPSKSPNSMESRQVNWKHGPGGSLGEQPRPKRGRKPAINYEALMKEEDVCFACFDGGKLILCDKRSCPKAYHMECTGRESEFFHTKGQWFCGWHVCGHCMRSATMHCYTCPNAYCNGCIKEADFLCLRKGRGLCELCYRIVYMIEHNLSIDSEGVVVNFDDEETYECLFRDYWKDLKEKLSLTWSEISKAYKTKDEGEPLGRGFHTERLPDDEGSTDSDCRAKKRQSPQWKRKRNTRNAIIDDANTSDFEEEEEEEEEDEEEEILGKPVRGQRKGHELMRWASKALIDFLNSLKEDSKKPVTLLSLKKLVLSYVDSNKLGIPRRRGLIRCDEKLQSLFGKKHVGKFEMMKLLNKHIAPKRSTNAKSLDFMSGSEDKVEFDNGDDKVHQQQKFRKKLEDTRHLKLDPFKYAAIDINNISLIYLKRSLLEDLQKDSNFESKVKGAFVRIRVPSMVNKNETCYRLVQIVGIKHVPLNAHNNVKKDVVLEILNLQKREEISVDLISGQDFTEEECQRLRQSVKCGLLKAMTVGELQEKARILREAKVKDWLDTELLRLSHLRDRASEKGRRKDLRECVERLQVLSSPSERERQLRASIEVNVDPHMDPDYESDKAAKSMKEFQGTQNPQDMGFVKKQCEMNNALVKHANCQDNGGWAEADPDAGTLETLAGWGDLKDSGHHAVGLNCQGSLFQKDPANQNATGSNHQGSFIQKRNDQGEGTRQDDGWGEDLKGNDQDSGWGQSGGGLKKSDGWGKEGDGFTKEGRGGGNTKDDTWAGNAGENTKDDGWGVVGSFKKEDGWICREDARNRKKDTRDTNVGNGMNGHSWGRDVGTSEKGGWGDGGGDGQKHDSWGDGGRKHDCWDGNVSSQNDDGWGPGGGGSANGDGWGDIAGGESEGGWGNPAGKNEEHGVEASGNETYTGCRWGKAGGTPSDQGWGTCSSGAEKSDQGWGTRSSGAERSSSWNNWGFREAGSERRERKTRADTGGFYRNSAHHTKAPVPDVAAGTGVNGRGLRIESENEKVWYYQDPSKTTQGPFSMEQLRKWEKTKLFPVNLRVWRATESPDASMLLTDALQGRFHNDLPPGFDQYPGRGPSASREDLRSVDGLGGSRPGSSWQDKGRRPKHNEHWNGGSGHNRNHSNHHHLNRPGNDGRFSIKKKDIPCRYFAQGMCKKGDECNFMH